MTITHERVPDSHADGSDHHDHPQHHGWGDRAERAERTATVLAQAARTHGGRRRALVDEAIRLNLPVARALASRYRNRGQSKEDLEQVACLALTVAVQRFEPGRGKEFLSYAVPTIRGELKRHFRDAGWTVRPPRRLQETRAAIPEVRAALAQELGRTPSAVEVAEELGCEVEEVTEAGATDHCFRPASLEDRGRDDAGQAWADLLGADDRGFDRAEAVAMLAPACRDLSRRDQRIVFLRYFQEWPQGQIAQEIGVSQVQVSRLLTRILATLRADLLEAPVAD